MIKKTTYINSRIIVSMLLFIGTITACTVPSSPNELNGQNDNPTADNSGQSVVPSNQETPLLPVTPTQAQPTFTVEVIIRNRVSPEELAPTADNSGQSVVPSNQETPLLPVTPTQAQPTFTVEVIIRNRVSPEELAPYISWGGWGGGGSIRDCGDGIPNTDFQTFGDSEVNPAAGNANVYQIAIGEMIFLKGCDFFSNDEIVVTYHLPNGNAEQDKQLVNEYGGWTSTWTSIPGEPTGLYEVDVDSSSGTFTGNFTVSEAVKPTMTVICPPEEKEGKVVLTGFQPDEEVLIARYGDPESEDPNLVDFTYITMEHDGTAIFEIPNEYVLIIAIGQVIQHTLPGYGDIESNVSAFNICYEPLVK